MFRSRVAATFWTVTCLGAALATRASARQERGEALEGWRAAHGEGWRIDLDDGTGAVEFLYGGTRRAPVVPRTDEDWFGLARGVLAESAPLHAIELETLVEDRALFLPLGMVGTNDKMTVRFRQAVHGVPVDGGSVNLLFDARGGLLSVQTHALPEIRAFPVTPSIDPGDAVVKALSRFQTDTGLEGVLSGLPELVVAQLREDVLRVPRLAYKATVQWTGGVDASPEGYTYFVDARTGAIAHRVSSIHRLDVGGTVLTMSTPGVHPDTYNNPVLLHTMRYARVDSPVGTVYTDAAGNFNFPGVTGPLQCTFTYAGTFNDVYGYPTHTLQADLSGTGNTVVLNPAPQTERTTAQANVFVAVNRMRDWIRSVNPFDSTADFVHVAVCNLAGSCNSFFNFSAINFYQSGSGCPNTAYSTVIAHEDGHWLGQRYGLVGYDGIYEGSADTFALLCYDDRYVGRDYFGVGQHLRDGENTTQFCGDCCYACYGMNWHREGEVFMGANWKVRRNLVNTIGTGPGDALADALFLGWHNAYDQGMLKSIIETQYLTLDDDDGNLDNGTPHFQQIDDAFRLHGFPGFQGVPIRLKAPQVADTTDELGPYLVLAEAGSNVGAAITAVTLHHRVGWTGPYTQTAMTEIGGGNWRASLAGQPSPQRIFYYVVATDSLGNYATYPHGGAASSAAYFSIGSSIPALTDDFETAKGWVVSNVSSSGTIGKWERVDPFGTFVGGARAQPEEDNPLGTGTHCFVTGQGTPGGVPYEADVDHGPRTLTSPALDLGHAASEVRYAYWHYVSSGDDDQLVVELSSDGTNWTVARTHSGGLGGWKQDKIDVGTHLAPGSSIRVRFRVEDDPENSITETAIDDVRVSMLLASSCSLPAVFCTGKIDSNFCEPSISFQGYASLGSGAPFTISVSEATGQRNGLLFYGYGSQAVPFNGGVNCCRAPVRRTPTQSTGGTAFACDGSMTFDFGAWARSGVDPVLLPGQSCAAQYFYRDPSDPFATALSNAVSFTICP